MFLDAVYNARLYATENGNVKLWYTVNGRIPASDLDLTDTYDFHIEISHFNSPSDSEKTAIVEVVSDYGKVVWSKSVAPSDSNVLDFTLKSDTARYFYLRIYSTCGDRTWSPAVWTGRAYDECPEPEFEGIKIPKSNMKIASCTSGNEPEKLINDNPKDAWCSDAPDAQIVIELSEEKEICAIGYWPHEISRDNPDISEAQYGSRFLSGYEYLLSSNGESFQTVAEGTMLCHGGEQKARFEPVKARFVKLNLKSTTGSASHKPHYLNSPLMIGEFDIYSV